MIFSACENSNEEINVYSIIFILCRRVISAHGMVWLELRTLSGQTSYQCMTDDRISIFPPSGLRETHPRTRRKGQKIRIESRLLFSSFREIQPTVWTIAHFSLTCASSLMKFHSLELPSSLPPHSSIQVEPLYGHMGKLALLNTHCSTFRAVLHNDGFREGNLVVLDRYPERRVQNRD